MLLVAFAQSWSDLDVDSGEPYRLRALLQTEGHAVIARARENVLDGEAPLDNLQGVARPQQAPSVIIRRMHTVASIASPIPCINAELSQVTADVLVVPWFEDEAASVVPGLDSASSGEVARALKTKEFQPKRYELFVTRLAGHDWKAERLMLIGAGKLAES